MTTSRTMESTVTFTGRIFPTSWVAPARYVDSYPILSLTIILISLTLFGTVDIAGKISGLAWTSGWFIFRIS